MQNEQSSIFDQDFLQETSIRRRQLMPLALKIYVWYFMGMSVLSIISAIYFYFIPEYSNRFDLSGPLAILSLASSLFFLALTFLSNLFILLEKRSAISFAILVVFLSVIFRSYYFYKIFYVAKAASTYNTITSIGWVLIKIPYVIILLKIKRPWETVGVAAK